MKVYQIYAIIITGFIITLTISSCAAMQTSKEKEIINLYSEERGEKYADLLVDITEYQTNGAIYQEKYHKLLIGLATEFIEKKNIKIAKKSLGFYFDTKSGEKNKLFLGFDIDAGKLSNESYVSAAKKLVNENTRDIIDTIHSCRSIFDEDEIVGMVIGWKWSRNGSSEQVNVWISHKDVIKFIDMELSFKELVQRSIVTDTLGKIIRLPI